MQPNSNTSVHLLEELPPRNQEPTGILDSIKYQWNSSQRNFLVIKVALVTIAFTLLILNSANNFIHHTDPVSCIQDLVQEWVLPITKFLETHVGVKNIMMATASLLLDINMVLLGLRWIFYGDTLRLFPMIFVFYLFRGLLQRLFAVRFPDNYIFAYPGVFSVTVPYFTTNDFFFSGHIGICTIFFLEYRKDGASRILQGFALLTFLVNFLNLLFTEGHYSIDLATGVITAHYIYRLGIWLEPSIVYWSERCFKPRRSQKSNEEQGGHVLDTAGIII